MRVMKRSIVIENDGFVLVMNFSSLVAGMRICMNEIPPINDTYTEINVLLT